MAGKQETANAAPTYLRGQCFCASVQFELMEMEALAHTWCHCTSCQRFHSAASVPSMLFPIKIEDGKLSDSKEQLKVVKGEDSIKLYRHSPESITRRFSCQECGTPVFNSIPDMGIVNTFPSCFGSAIDFKPQFHSNYGEKIVVVPDGLPKYKGFRGSELLDDQGRPLLSTLVL
eukprot:TRINITY_DN18931_c0_g1_i1.p1 TRINITY_DN18931_c0_g1~~TRINITY_DN18931_c0_g1_i1.p1  ORF type:complete len:174 (+),score=17.37 TRINITY_DN18931_c0_g1_i1:562-1083(+)